MAGLVCSHTHLSPSCPHGSALGRCWARQLRGAPNGMNDSGSPPPHHGLPGAEPTGTPSGYVCPRCGGALWERRDGQDPTFECRIGHALEALELWVAHCTARNAALEAAARALAENAALARKLAVWSRERGNLSAGARIEAEAVVEEQYYEQVRSMLEGLEPINSPP